MRTGQTMRLSPRALEILRAGVVDDDGRLRLAGRAESGEMRAEIVRALTAMGWVWSRAEGAFVQRPDPVTALAAALETGEVTL